MMDMNISENKERKRFETIVEGKTAFIEYIRAQDSVYLTHTEVPKELEGKGIASSMVKQVLELIKGEDHKLVPLCPFVAAYVKRHPEWRELLAKGYNV
jgi:predicted GNAT family acetyltransferase